MVGPEAVVDGHGDAADGLPGSHDHRTRRALALDAEEGVGELPGVLVHTDRLPPAGLVDRLGYLQGRRHARAPPGDHGQGLDPLQVGFLALQGALGIGRAGVDADRHPAAVGHRTARAGGDALQHPVAVQAHRPPGEGGAGVAAAGDDAVLVGSRVDQPVLDLVEGQVALAAQGLAGADHLVAAHRGQAHLGRHGHLHWDGRGIAHLVVGQVDNRRDLPPAVELRAGEPAVTGCRVGPRRQNPAVGEDELHRLDRVVHLQAQVDRPVDHRLGGDPRQQAAGGDVDHHGHGDGMAVAGPVGGGGRQQPAAVVGGGRLPGPGGVGIDLRQQHPLRRRRIDPLVADRRGDEAHVHRQGCRPGDALLGSQAPPGDAAGDRHLHGDDVGGEEPPVGAVERRRQQPLAAVSGVGQPRQGGRRVVGLGQQRPRPGLAVQQVPADAGRRPDLPFGAQRCGLVDHRARVDAADPHRPVGRRHWRGAVDEHPPPDAIPGNAHLQGGSQGAHGHEGAVGTDRRRHVLQLGAVAGPVQAEQPPVDAQFGEAGALGNGDGAGCRLPAHGGAQRLRRAAQGDQGAPADNHRRRVQGQGPAVEPDAHRRLRGAAGRRRCQQDQEQAEEQCQLPHGVPHSQEYFRVV